MATQIDVGVRLRMGATGLDQLGAVRKGLAEAGVETKLLDQRAAELAAELAKLRDQQALIDAFRRQKSAVADAATALDAAQQTAQKLGKEMGGLESPTKAQQQAFDRARKAARDADAAYQAARVTLQGLRGPMAAAGVASDDLAAAQVRVHRALADVQGEVQKTTDWAQRMAAGQRAQAAASDAAGTASSRAASGVKALGGASEDGAGKVNALLGQLRNLSAIGLASQFAGEAVQLVKDVGATAQAYQELRARIKLVTGDGVALQAAMTGVAEIAKRTNTSLDATGALFLRVGQAAKDMGLSQQTALQLTETINKAVQIGGESAESSRAALAQFNQALQSGVLRGEEFNSIMEQAPGLARALAGGLQVPIGALRQLAQDGKLTADVVIQALQTQKTQIDKDFAALPQTVAKAVQNLKTQWEVFVGTLAGGGAQTSALAEGINALARNLDTVAGVAARAGSVLTAAIAVEGVAALAKLSGGAGSAIGAVAMLGKAVSDVPKVINITVAMAGFELGWQIGVWLRENTELARKLGVGLVGYFEQMVNGLVLLKDVATGIFGPSGALSAAFAKFHGEVAQTNKTLRDMWADAAVDPQVAAARTAAAAAETKALGNTAATAGQQVAAGGQAGAAGMQVLGGAAGAAGSAVGGVGKAADTAAEAFAGLAAKMSASTPPMLDATAKQIAAVARLAVAGGKAAEVFAKDLPDAIGKLSGPELAAFGNTLVKGLSDARAEAQRLADTLVQGSPEQVAALGRVGAATALIQQAMADVGAAAAKSLGVDLPTAMGKVSPEFAKLQGDFATLIQSTDALRATGVDTGAVVGAALGKMIDGAKNQAELDAISNLLRSMGKDGRIAGQDVADGLEMARDKAVQLKDALDDARPGIQGLREAARKAGVDIGELTTGFSKGFKDGIKAIDDLVVQIDKAGVSAERASPQLTAALDKQLTAAKTRDEIQRVQDKYRELGSQGLITGEDLRVGTLKAQDAFDKLVPGINSTTEAATKLGIQTRTQMNQTATESVNAWRVIRDSSDVTIAEQIKGFEKARTAAGEASGGMISGQMQLDEALMRSRAEALGLGADFEAAMARSDTAIAKTAKKVDELGRELDARGNILNPVGGGDAGGFTRIDTKESSSASSKSSSMQPIGGSNAAPSKTAPGTSSVKGATYDAAGWATNPDGSRLTMGTYTPPPDVSGNWEWIADISRGAGGRWVPRGGNQLAGDGGSHAFGGTTAPTVPAVAAPATPVPASTVSDAADLTAELRKLTTLLAQQSASAPATAHTVTVNISGGGSRTLNMASASDSTALTQLLQQLADSARSAGITLGP